MSLSQPIMSVLCECASAFSQPTWRKVEVLIIGTLFARGRRTVTAALRQMGLHEASNFALYHQVLNRARWSALELSRRVVVLLVRTFGAVGGELTFVIDETLERRWGRRINKRGHDRDPRLRAGRTTVSGGQAPPHPPTQPTVCSAHASGLEATHVGATDAALSWICLPPVRSLTTTIRARAQADVAACEANGPPGAASVPPPTGG
jgi:hypothetical protein